MCIIIALKKLSQVLCCVVLFVFLNFFQVSEYSCSFDDYDVYNGMKVLE